MDTTMKISSFVLFILIGSTVFSLSFQAVDGPVWVEHLLTSLPGGQLGFLIVVNVLIFFLAFFLDFFELSFIVIPLIAPVAEKLGIDLVWFGVLLAVNMQTSFMHPPFGFALFYLRSVAPANDYDDRITARRIQRVTTGQIYWGAVPFVIIQIIMVSMIIAFPQLVSSGASGGPKVDIDKAFQQMQRDSAPTPGPSATTPSPDASSAAGSAASQAGTQPQQGQGEFDDADAMKRLLELSGKKP
jgi:TRAP-type mannitol/chloroaromatic compound transport system permease large subunit